MSEYKARVVDVGSLRSDSEEIVAGSLFGTIEIAPPLHIGPAFEQAVLGRGNHYAGLSEILTDSQATYLLAECKATNLPLNERAARLHEIAKRAGYIATYPDATTIEMFNADLSLFPDHR